MSEEQVAWSWLWVACWEDWRDAEDRGHTCMLPDGHDGAHEFTPDSDIFVRFP